MDGGAVRAVALVLCLRYEVRLADFTSLLMTWLHDLGKQLPICRKDCIFEIVAVDSVPADALNAGVFFTVVRQKAVSIRIVAAELFNEGIAPL